MTAAAIETFPRAPLPRIRSLAFEGMSFSFDPKQLLFDKVTFTLPSEACALWVRSPGGGRGKSTLLRILAGLLRPTHGNFLINGKSVADMSFSRFLFYRMAIGYGFDLGGLLNNKTLYENLALPLQYHKLLSDEEIDHRIHHAIELFGLGNAKDMRPFSVSGSQRKVTCVVRALVHWPEIALLDDPLIGLKEENRRDLIRYIEEGFASRGLRQIIFTGEDPGLARHFSAQEILISPDSFTLREAA